MKITPISSKDEERLIQDVKSAIELSNKGANPSQAIGKIASSRGYGPNFAERMVEMFNTSKTLAHLKTASGEDRAADFELADVNEVMKDLTGKEISSAPQEIISKEANFMEIGLDRSLPSVKVAGERDRYEAGLGIRIDGARARVRKEAEKVKLKSFEATENYRRSIQKFASYFRESYSDSFEDVDYKVACTFGEEGTRLMDAVWEAMGTQQKRQKRASAVDKVALLDPDSKVCRMVKESVNNALRAVQCKAAAEKAEQEAKEYTATLGNKLAAASIEDNKIEATEDEEPREIGEENEREGEDPVTQVSFTAVKDKLKKKSSEDVDTSISIQKEGAFTYAILNKILNSTSGMNTSGSANRKADQVDMLENASKSLAPEAKSRLRNIEAEGVLQDMLIDDPVISHYDPQVVIRAYNDLSMVSPEIATNPMILRPFLRKVLESGTAETGASIDPFDVKQLTDISSNITADKPGLSMDDAIKLTTTAPKPKGDDMFDLGGK